MRAIVMTLLAVPALALAEKMPKGAYPSSKFDEAREAAKAEGKALIYIETDSATTCPKCQWGTTEAYAELKRDYVLVVKDDAREDCPAVPALNSQVSETSKIGNFTPRITVVKPDNLEFITGTDYTNMSANKRWDKALAEAVEKAMANTTPEAGEKKDDDKTTEAGEDDEFQNWTNRSGKTIRAVLVSQSDTTVTLKLENGKMVDYPLLQLSEESLELLE